MKLLPRLTLAALAIALPSAAFADINSTATLSAGSTMNLDTGTVGTTGGDLLFNGSSLTPQGNAIAFGFGTGGAGVYGFLTQPVLQQDAGGFLKTPLTSLVLNTVIAVKTNGGNYAKLLVTASSSSSLSFQFTTYGATASGGGGSGGSGGGGTGGGTGTGSGGSANSPSITEVQNNYSYIVPGLPNYGIAPGTLFIVKGSKLATNTTPILQSSAGGLPTSLNGASISVTVNGATTVPGIYYTSAGQLAAVLPSNTPAGTGTITVTTSGQTSNSAQMVVVQSALGLDVATDANYNFFSAANSASPGQTIILWGSGVGADTANDDKTYPLKTDNLTNIPLQVWIGGLQGAISYQGRSQYPGVDQVVVTIPSGVSPGCGVSVLAVSGNIVSNSITLPVAPGGGTCSDANSATTPGLLQSLTGKNTVSFGTVSLLRSTLVTASSGSNSGSSANAYFASFPGSELIANASNPNIPSIGSCVNITAAGGGVLPTGLNAGTITVSGAGAQTTLQTLSSLAGDSYATLTSIPSGGASYTFTGSGGKNVGAFTATVNFPPALVWTNQPTATTTINRAQGYTVMWTGGAPGTYVSIEGQSTVGEGATLASATFTCLAPVAAGQFTVPSWILLSLPPNIQGSMSLSNQTNPQSFSASGLDYAYGVATSLIDTQVTYQ